MIRTPDVLIAGTLGVLIAMPVALQLGYAGAVVGFLLSGGVTLLVLQLLRPRG